VFVVDGHGIASVVLIPIRSMVNEKSKTESKRERDKVERRRREEMKQKR
jgi:hypothetical protein